MGSDDLVDDLAGSARECPALRDAVVLAGWVDTGRAVTAKGVLRRADVPAAGRALGIELPERVRSAADVPALHWPWTAALGAGLLSIDGGRAVPASALTGWRSANADEVLDLWTRGFAAALTGLFDDDEGSEGLEIGRLALTVLASDPEPTRAELATAISHAILDAGYELYRTFARGFGVRDPAEVTLELLAAFGTVTGTPGRRITPLGRWALSVIGTRGVALLGSSDDAEEDGTYQLKIALQHVRPACWRRVLMSASATLGELHEVIQVAFAWDDDHLHGFTVGRRRYGDPYFDFEYDEHEITLATAFARTRKPITYTYDFGDDWRHEITLEKVVEPAPAATDPICVDGRGDAPVEDCGDDEAAWIAFDKVGINTRLARLGGGGQEAQARLRDDIEVILTDAYGEAEQMTAFQTVLDEEIDFPVPATLLGNPVVVTGLVEDDATLELRARCKGKHAKGLVSFADLEFRPGTVESWLHAAYVTYLGRSPSGVTPPSTWDGLTRWLS
ncbi:plasmid pRiA4b ORF-3 family protein [Saccharopolyspora erythraea]|uniref:Plasmid pRiA4b Orf3-like domain-containing protein n=1 Tax=Saccharopolyspora erythraea TaxID=1836 RepID=A0ABP3MVT8_SACER|nr:plasmid pRiA4b ORF-3 family protein [Saccharopolyspora erythraea]QRK90825.1 plasmid pRiA4b ORF-3 family protein [Saccharopolyspora erythraea]